MIRIIDIYGQLQLTVDVDTKNTVVIPVNTLAPGVCFLQGLGTKNPHLMPFLKM